MSITKLLRFILILILSLFQIWMLFMFNLYILIFWNPRKRLIEFYNIVKRKPLSRAGKPPPAKWNDPTLGEHSFVRLKDIKLHCVSSGDDSKPLMLFLHGFLDCWYTWRFQIREFSKNYRVVALDMRGYSLSDCPEGKSNYSLMKNSTDIAEVIEALGYKDCILVGYDWGAMIARITALRFPDKISKIIIFNLAEKQPFYDHIGKELADSRFIWPIFYSHIPYSCEFLLTFSDLKALGSIFWNEKNGIRKENLTEEDLEVYKYALSQKGVIYAVLESYRSLFIRYPQLPVKKTYDYNILIIYGTKDEWVKKEMMEDSQKYFPNGVFKTLESGTRYMHEDQPQLVNEFINDFLN